MRSGLFAAGCRDGGLGLARSRVSSRSCPGRAAVGCSEDVPAMKEPLPPIRAARRTTVGARDGLQAARGDRQEARHPRRHPARCLREIASAAESTTGASEGDGIPRGFEKAVRWFLVLLGRARRDQAVASQFRDQTTLVFAREFVLPNPHDAPAARHEFAVHAPCFRRAWRPRMRRCSSVGWHAWDNRARSSRPRKRQSGAARRHSRDARVVSSFVATHDSRSGRLLGCRETPPRPTRRCFSRAQS